MSISSTGLYGSATIVNSDLFNDVEDLKEQVTTLSTSYLDTTREHREDISQNRQDISQNRLDISLNRQDISQNRLDISLNRQDISQNRLDISLNRQDISQNRFDISQNTFDISLNRFDISQNTFDISKNRFDISQNKADISKNRVDISQNKADISKNRVDISQNKADISKNSVDISQNKADISKNRVDISQNKADISKNRVDISQNTLDISENTFDISLIKDDITDISSNKAFIRTLQSLDYSILYANAPAQWPTPPIQSGYNGVYCTDAGIDVVAQNFLALNIGTPSVLSIQSTDTSDSTINIITKGINFTNAIDNSNQLIIDNEGIFLKQFDRDDPLNVSEGFINLQDWMAKIQEIVLKLGGIDGNGYSFGDLISDIFGFGSVLAQVGVFAAVYSAMKSLFIKDVFFDALEAGSELAKDFKDEFVESSFSSASNTALKTNAESAFANLSTDKIVAFLFKHLSQRNQVYNFKYHELGGVKTYFQSIGGVVDASKVVPQNLFRTMFENRCGFKNNIYVPNIFFGAAFAANALNHDYFPGAYSLNDLKLNVDSINTNIGTINTSLLSLQIYLNSPPATFNIYLYDSDMYGNIYLSGNDRSGSFAYWILSDISQKKRLINVNDGDTVNIILSETIIAFTNLPGMVDIAVLITFNGVTTWEAYAGDQRRSTISYTLKSTDSLQIKTGWWGPNINDPVLPGMLDPVNFSIKETINTVYYTKSQIDAKGYLTTIPLEYITETELNAKGYLTSIPSEFITESELNAKGYLTSIPSEFITETELAANNYSKTQIDTNHYTKTQIDTNIYTKAQIDTKGYLSIIPAEYITESELAASNYTKTQIDTNIYTKTQIDAKGYLTTIPSEYITETELNSKGYLTTATNTYTLPTASTSVLGGVRVDGSTININNGVISSTGGTAQVNSDWTQTNTSLKSFIQNKPTAGTNISFQGNTITNTIIGSPTQNIIDLNTNHLIIKDKPNSVKEDITDIPLTSINEPTITSPTFTESIRTFTHSGTTENQTTHTITIGQNTICDILMIGGGGGGGKDRAGGGGSGALILSVGNILSGTYTIRVGNGSLGATTGVNPVNGYDCEIVNSTGTTIFRAKGGGGGQSLNVENAPDGGSGGGKSSQFPALGGNVVSTNIVNGITTGPVITTTYGVYGNIGGRNITNFNGANLDAMDGAGGGGIGQGGSTSGSLVQVDSQFVVNNGGNGGDGLYFATINGVVYNFKNYFNINGIQDGTTGNFFIGGGGGGGDNNGGVAGIGGKGGGGKGGESGVVGSPASGYGSGGGGGGGGNNNGGNGSAGIVAIKFRTIVSAAIPEGNPITHKTLNFAYDNKLLRYDFTNQNTEATWKAYASTIPNFTYSLDSFLTTFDPDAVWTGNSVVGWVQMTLPSTHNFLSITYGLGSQGIGDVRLLINGPPLTFTYVPKSGRRPQLGHRAI
jgi:hypothetical protein